MESVVRYKFKSSTMEYSVAFSGPHIGVLELKKAIVTEQNMSAGSEAILELHPDHLLDAAEEISVLLKRT